MPGLLLLIIGFSIVVLVAIIVPWRSLRRDEAPLDAQDSARALLGEELFLPGHFPGNPIFPGVIQLEALAQAGAIAVLAHERYAGKLPLFGGVEKVRWRRIVRPGDELRLEVEMERVSARGGWGSATATVDGEECCRARLMFAIADAPETDA